MINNIEAIKEAISFIQHNWIGKAGIWKGDIVDFVGAVVYGNVTQFEVQNLIKAAINGEPIPVDDIGGIIENNKVTTVWVTKCMD